MTYFEIYSLSKEEKEYEEKHATREFKQFVFNEDSTARAKGTTYLYKWLSETGNNVDDKLIDDLFSFEDSELSRLVIKKYSGKPLPLEIIEKIKRREPFKGRYGIATTSFSYRNEIKNIKRDFELDNILLFLFKHFSCESDDEKRKIVSAINDVNSKLENDITIEWKSKTQKDFIISEINKYRVNNPLEDNISDSLIPKTKRQVKPTKHIAPNNRLVKKMHDGSIQNGEINFQPLGNKQKDLTIPVNINYDDSKIVKGHLIGFERTVHNAICSRWEANKGSSILVTPAMIYRDINNMHNNASVPAKASNEIAKILRKLMLTMVEIDITEELRHYVNSKGFNKYKNNIKSLPQSIKDGKRESQAIQADITSCNMGGHEISVFEIKQEPILHTYSKVTNQIVSFDSALLNTQSKKDDKGKTVLSGINSTVENMYMKEYLNIRIYEMKQLKDKNSNLFNIRYDDFMQKGRIDIEEYSNQRKKKSKIKETMKKQLDHIQYNGGITGYKEIKEKNKDVGIRIIL